MSKIPGFLINIYNAIEAQHMILQIKFEERDHEYCSQNVLQSFQHLGLSSFQFYCGGTSNNLEPVRHIPWAMASL
jgi:hypothetical protein